MPLVRMEDGNPMLTFFTEHVLYPCSAWPEILHARPLRRLRALLW